MLTLIHDITLGISRERAGHDPEQLYPLPAVVDFYIVKGLAVDVFRVISWQRKMRHPEFIQWHFIANAISVFKIGQLGHLAIIDADNIVHYNHLSFQITSKFIFLAATVSL